MANAKSPKSSAVLCGDSSDTVSEPTGEHAAGANHTVRQQRRSEKATKQLAIWAVLALAGMAASRDSSDFATSTLRQYPLHGFLLMLAKKFEF